MKTTRVTFVALTVLGTLALPAVAGHEIGERRDVRVASIAHRVEAQARRVHRLAERHAHHRTFLEEKALMRLHVLEKRARDFHRTVERSDRRARTDFRADRRGRARVLFRDDRSIVRDHRTREEFRELLRAFYRAENSLHWMHAYDVVDREFDELARLVERLEASFDTRGFGWSNRRWRHFGSLTVPFMGPGPSHRFGRG